MERKHLFIHVRRRRHYPIINQVSNTLSMNHDLSKSRLLLHWIYMYSISLDSPYCHPLQYFSIWVDLGRRCSEAFVWIVLPLFDWNRTTLSEWIKITTCECIIGALFAWCPSERNSRDCAEKASWFAFENLQFSTVHVKFASVVRIFSEARVNAAAFIRG